MSEFYHEATGEFVEVDTSAAPLVEKRFVVGITTFVAPELGFTADWHTAQTLRELLESASSPTGPLVGTPDDAREWGYVITSVEEYA